MSGAHRRGGGLGTVPPTASGAGPGGLPHACDPAPSADVSGTPASTGTGAGGRSRPRLVGIDAARGVALLGMMSVHTIEAYDADGEVSLAWSLASGKSAALFAVLAGVGVAFLSGGRRQPTGRAWRASAVALLVRALLIGAIGLLIGYVVPVQFAAVILPYYALLFLFAIPLLSLSVRALVALAATIAVAMPVLSHLLRAGSDLAAVPNLTVSTLLDQPGATLRDLALTGVYPALPWMAYVCAGLAVGRLLLSSRRTVVTIALVGAGLFVSARLVSWFLLDVIGGRDELEEVALRSMGPGELDAALSTGWSGITPSDTGWWLATRAPHSSTPLDLVSTIGIALAVLGVCILVGRTTTGVLRPLAAAGSMTLTLYCLHLLMLSWSDMPGGPTGLLVQVVILVLFALLWSQHHARGPLEEIVAAATGWARRTVLPADGGGDATADERARRH